MIPILSVILCVFYLSFIAIFIIEFWQKAKFEDDTAIDISFPVSVVVAFKNEAKNLPNLLKCLAKQSFQSFELVLVNDHSSDNFLSHISENKNIKLINAIGTGKKNALSEGIAQSGGELIICTDADCLPNPFWVETLVRFYRKNRPDMIIAPVEIVDNQTIFGQIQALEFMSLQASTAGAACAGIPIMCNGANLAFTKEIWQNNQANLHTNKLSGDDMFLMMSLKKQKGKILYLKSKKAVVFTSACKTFAEFFNQRKRWVSKSPAYSDRDVILSALSVFGVSAIMLLNLVWGYWAVLGSVFIAKFVFDSILLFVYGRFYKSAQNLKWMLPLSIIYPFYVFFTTFFGLFGKFKWR